MIPDVKLSDKGGLAVYTLYRAGILTGTDKYGRYLPQEQIIRSAVATIITNIINSDCRKSFMPEPLPIQVVSLQLNTTSQSIYIGDTAKLTCSMIPNNAEDKRVTWTTSNSKVALVSGGVVTGVGEGTAKIRVTASNGVYAEAVISVSKRVSVKILTAYGIPNSAGGVGPTIVWRNDSGKTIKYATFTAIPYNSVGDIVSSDIGGVTSVDLKVTGPIKPFNRETDIVGSCFFYKNSIPSIELSYPDKLPYVLHWSGEKYFIKENDYRNVFNLTSKWEPVWYNYSISRISITKVSIEYMDGSKESISNPTIWHRVWWKN